MKIREIIQENDLIKAISEKKPAAELYIQATTCGPQFHY